MPGMEELTWSDLRMSIQCGFLLIFHCLFCLFVFIKRSFNLFPVVCLLVLVGFRAGG